MEEGNIISCTEQVKSAQLCPVCGPSHTWNVLDDVNRPGSFGNKRG